MLLKTLDRGRGGSLGLVDLSGRLGGISMGGGRTKTGAGAGAGAGAGGTTSAGGAGLSSMEGKHKFHRI